MKTKVLFIMLTISLLALTGCGSAEQGDQTQQNRGIDSSTPTSPDTSQDTRENQPRQTDKPNPTAPASPDASSQDSSADQTEQTRGIDDIPPTSP